MLLNLQIFKIDSSATTQLSLSLFRRRSSSPWSVCLWFIAVAAFQLVMGHDSMIEDAWAFLETSRSSDLTDLRVLL